MSTTERQRGQVLVLFVGGLVTLIIVAALAFDAGAMLLERRDQQNAADAAALAGARYLPGNSGAAKSAAQSVATANGFTAGSGSVSVTINVPPGPPTSPSFQNASSIEVTISSTRPSIFAGVMGVLGWPVAARAVATNRDDIAAPFSMLALDPSACKALSVGGSGMILAEGNIQVNSACDKKNPAALDRDGTSTITVNNNGACNAVGTINAGPGGTGGLICTQNEGASLILDPLAGLPAPPKPSLAPAMKLVLGPIGLKPPDDCPGSSGKPPSESSPALCKFSPTVDYKAATWQMYPGLYPGGLDLGGGTFYMEPGIYWIGGGGLAAGQNGVVLKSVDTDSAICSVDSESVPLPDCGVLIYNSQIEGASIGTVVLNGSDAQIDLYPLRDGTRWSGLVIFQDRIDIGGDSVDDVIVTGGSSNMQVNGTVYVPDGQVRVNGSSGTITTDQVIADQFRVTGNGGTIQVLYREPFLFKFIAAGLVE